MSQEKKVENKSESDNQAVYLDTHAINLTSTQVSKACEHHHTKKIIEKQESGTNPVATE